MPEPRFKPGQEARTLADKYILFGESIQYGFEIEWQVEHDGTWHSCYDGNHGPDDDAPLRRKPEPPKPIEGWVVILNDTDPGDTLYHSKAEANGVSLCHSSLHDKRVVHLREVDPDTVTVPRAVVEEILDWRRSLTPGYCEAFDKLAEAVKGESDA